MMIDAIYNCISIKSCKENFFFSMATCVWIPQIRPNRPWGIYGAHIIHKRISILVLKKNNFLSFPITAYDEFMILYTTWMSFQYNFIDDSCNLNFIAISGYRENEGFLSQRRLESYPRVSEISPSCTFDGV